MKTSIIYLLVISFLFQSCYTYKTIDIKDTALVVGKNYKIKQDSKFVKSKLQAVNDSVLTIVEGKVVKDVAISQIKAIKKAEFSPLKTVGLILGVGLVVVGVVGAIEMSSFDMGGMSYGY